MAHSPSENLRAARRKIDIALSARGVAYGWLKKFGLPAPASWKPGVHPTPPQTKLHRFFHPWFRNQGGVNQALLHLGEQQEREIHRLAFDLEEAQGRIEVLEKQRDSLFETQQAILRRLADQEMGLHKLELALAQQTGGAPAAAAPSSTPVVTSALERQVDQFYLEFENRYRGTREQVTEKLLYYLPLLEETRQAAGVAPGDFSVLDIGCGRGEWLTLLKERGYAIGGIDLNGRMAIDCQEQGLPVLHGNGLHHLRDLPSESLWVISAFHVIEHLSFAELIEIFRQAFRVLRPGGCVIFETPNPENFQVSTRTFYMDPTHKNPIPPDLALFVAESTGFRRFKAHRLQPGDVMGPGLDAIPAAHADPVIDDLLEYFRASWDYSVVAHK